MRTMSLVSLLFIFISTTSSRRCLAQSRSPSASGSQQCLVFGTVTSMQSGLGLKKARVSLRPVSADGDALGAVQMSVLGYGSASAQSQYSVMSQSDGSFCFENVKSGQYTMSGSKQGFLDTNYGAKSPTESGRTITVASEPLAPLALALVPQSVVSGKITDEDDEPVSGTSVALLMRMSVGGQIRYVPVRGGQSNDLGDFRLANVAPGTYYIVAEPRSRVAGSDDRTPRPLRTLYPGASSLAQATPIVVGPGEDRSGANIRLITGQTHHIRGLLLGLTTADQGTITIRPAEEEQVFIALGGANYKPDGRFDFADIAPGTYALTYFQVAGDSAKGARRIVVVGDRDVNDIVLPITGSAIITGQIRIDGDSVEGTKSIDLQKLKLTLVAADAVMGPNARATIQPDGQFVIKNIIPGRYAIQADPPPGTYLKSARYGQMDIRAQELDLTEGGSGELEIVYRYGLANVNGSVEDDGGTRTVGRIVLVPLLLDRAGRGIVFGASDASGAFLIKNVPPGRYRAYAFESIDYAALQEPEVQKALQSGGTELELAEGDQRSIGLHLISSEDQRHLTSVARGQQ